MAILLGWTFLAWDRREPIEALAASATPPPLTATVLDNPVKFRHLYFPNKNVYGAPPRGVEELTLRTSDAVTLNAWYRAPTAGGPLILYFHGNGGNVTSLGPQIEAFVEAGAGVLAIDYRGFGNSEGVPSEAGLYLDSEAAYEKARELGYGPSRLVIYGRSLGGGVATHLAAAKPEGAAALILESTFTSVEDVARRSHGDEAARIVSGFGSVQRMPAIDLPTLIIHGSADSTIPADMAETLQKASPRADLWMVKGATHNTVRKVAGAEYVARLRRFLEALP